MVQLVRLAYASCAVLVESALAALQAKRMWRPTLVQGIPPELRQTVWLQLCGANEKRGQHQPAYYADAAIKGAQSQFAHQIELVGGRAAGLS